MAVSAGVYRSKVRRRCPSIEAIPSLQRLRKFEVAPDVRNKPRDAAAVKTVSEQRVDRRSAGVQTVHGARKK
jgi:hypothetical protein